MTDWEEKAAEIIEWTRKELGVRYLDRLGRFGGRSVARSLTTQSHSGVDIFKAQTAKLSQLGLEIRTRCQPTDFITDNNGTMICGVGIPAGYRFPDSNSGTRRKIGANLAGWGKMQGRSSDLRNPFQISTRRVFFAPREQHFIDPFFLTSPDLGLACQQWIMDGKKTTTRYRGGI